MNKFIILIKSLDFFELLFSAEMWKVLNISLESINLINRSILSSNFLQID